MELSSILHLLNNEYVYKVSDHKYLVKVVSKHHDLKEINLYYVDKYDWTAKLNKVKMELVSTDLIHDLYEYVINTDSLSIKYFFELIDDNNKLYYGNSIFYDELINDKNMMFTFVPHMLDAAFFEVPEWAKGAVIYQIFAERFNPTDKKSSNWDLVPMKGKEHTNGTLIGIKNKLPYLKELGVDAIYLTPIFKANTNHRYDTVDYFEVDPLLGGNEALRALVEEAHKMGLKIILDLVFNHTSTDFFAFKDLLINQEKSKYKDWYFIKKWPLKVEKGFYLNFGYHPYMPKLNTLNKEVEAYLLKVTRYYLEEFKVDGYRLDVCDEVSHKFWKKFREVVKGINKDALIIGEIWFDSHSFLQGDECDTVMNYTFREAVKKLLNGLIDVKAFSNTLERERRLYNENCRDLSFNILSTHDTERIYHAFNKDSKKFRAAYLLSILLKGSGYIYYGDEQMFDGGDDPDCRRGMDFNHDLETLEFMKKLTSLKHLNPFKIGYYKCLLSDNGIYAFRRTYQNESYDVYLNTSNNPFKFKNKVRNLITNKEVDELNYLDFVVFKN